MTESLLLNSPGRRGGMWRQQLQWLREAWVRGETTMLVCREVHWLRLPV
jgi:hypothetical protein